MYRTHQTVMRMYTYLMIYDTELVRLQLMIISPNIVFTLQRWWLGGSVTYHFFIDYKFIKRVTTCLGLVCLGSSVNHSMYIQGKAYEAYVISYLTRKLSYRTTVKNNRCKRIYDYVRYISL